MKRWQSIGSLVMVAAKLSAAVETQAVVMTFDDHPAATQDAYGDVGTYKGFSFTENLDWMDTVGSPWPHGSVSGEFTMINNNNGEGVIVEASAGGDFTFDGLWHRKYDLIFPTPTRAGTIYGYSDGNPVWETDVTLTDNWTSLGGQAQAIDELRLELGDYFLIDDLALTNLVPEPASLLIWSLIGGLGIGACWWRRRKTA